MKNQYTPPQKILQKYADVLVNFALGGGKGIKKGEVVLVQAPEASRPLFIEVLRTIRKSGGHILTDYLLDESRELSLAREFYSYASDDQLNFFPSKYLKGKVNEIDHFLRLDAEIDPHYLKDVDPKKIMQRGEKFKKYREWLNKKENEGKFTWTIALYGTEAMAKEAQISLKGYWSQIIKACFLDKLNPIKEWKNISNLQTKYIKKLNSLKIDKVHVEGPEVDLWIKIGEKRKWLGGGGANIPSFELFTSPDWRGAEGWIKFNQPLYRYGSLIKDIRLEFTKGIVTKFSASKNEKVLEAMIDTPNASKIGEFSLTDKRFSKITKFMAETLYDENIDGPNGNTHIALGSAYKDCFVGDRSKLSKKQWQALGYNDSSVHTDIISTSPRTVTAYMKNGRSKVIYKNGQFVI